MLVEKKRFYCPAFTFETSQRTLPIELGYETYGTLSAAKDNAILVCHFFTGNSHAAGVYSPQDQAPGWWDALIGPGKALDTDKYFIIASDTLGNVSAKSPTVITTGPASVNPQTGKPYAMDFPIFTIKDMVRSQRLLLDHLGIKRLHMVIGPSMGGLQSFMWGRLYPQDVDRIVAVVAAPMMRPWTLMIPCQLGIEAIMLDSKWNGGDYYDKEPPTQGLLLAFKTMLVTTRCDQWCESNFDRNLADPAFNRYANPYASFKGKFLVESEIEKSALERMCFFDANHYIYIAKANTLYDLRECGESLDEALSKITPKVLMIIDETDLLFTPNQAEEARRSLPNAQVRYYNSENGHLSGIFDVDYFSAHVKTFCQSS